MQSFLLGVASSLLASALFVAISWFSFRRVRGWLIALVSRATEVGVLRSYRTQREANLDLANDLRKARWVRVLAGRGNELTRDSFRSVWREGGSRLERLEILLPDPDLGVGSWLARREAENAQHDSGYGGELLADQVRANIAYVKRMAGDSRHIELRVYDLPNVCRVIVTDHVAYLTPYSPTEHGRNSPCFVFRNPSSMYDFALRLFSTAWSSGRAPARQA